LICFAKKNEAGNTVVLKREIIWLSNNPYSASISVVEKKDEIIRIYSTLIGLNAITIDDRQLLSNMKELLNTIAEAKFYLL